MRWDSDTVLMPVPLRWAPEVAQLLADLRSGRTSTQGEAAQESVQVPDQGEWTQQMIADLAENVHYPGVRALFDRCSQEPGSWVAKPTVEAEFGISAIQLRNQLGALSKTTKRLFGGAEAAWPMQWKKEQGTYYYRMDATVARWWVEASGEQS